MIISEEQNKIQEAVVNYCEAGHRKGHNSFES